MSDASAARRRSSSSLVLPVVLAALALALAGSAAALAAQEPEPDAGPGFAHISRRIQSVEPRSGPPGTTVRVASGLMPHITPVRIGVGATRTGFEAFAELLTSEWGEFSTEIRVPEWATWDRSIRFIVFDFYFRPIAISEPFFVVSENGLVRREGVVSRGEGPDEGCLYLVDPDDGFRYPLVAGTQGLGSGTSVAVEGRLVGPSPCGQPGLSVERFERVPGEHMIPAAARITLGPPGARRR